MKLYIHDVITSRISDSLLRDETPWDRMLRNLPFVLGIRRIGIIILIYDDDTLRYTLCVAYDIEKDRDMLLRSSGCCIVRLTIEAGYDESLKVRWKMTLHSSREVEE